MFRLKTLALAVISASVVPYAGAADNELLDEVVVTARKKTESLSDVPISVAVFGGDQMKRDGVKSVTEMLRTANGVQYDSAGSIATGTITIRGLSQPGLVGDESNVPIFVDGVFVSGREGAFVPFNALERVEVLRGPQSALFGKGAFAGAVNYVTKKASVDAFEGEIEANAGSDEQAGGSLDVNIPISDTLAVRLDGYYNDSGGTHDDPDQDYILGDMRTRNGRFAVRWVPTEALGIDFSYSYNDNKDKVQPGFLLEKNAGRKVSPGLLYSESDFSPFGPDFTALNNVAFFGNPLTAANPPGFIPGINPGTYSTVIPSRFTNLYTVPDPNAVFDGDFTRYKGEVKEGNVLGGIRGYSDGSESTSKRAILSMVYDFDGYQLTSISGYSESDYETVVGYDYTVIDFSGQEVFSSWGGRPNNDRTDLSQEVRLDYVGGDALSWTAGLYYAENELDQRFTNSALLVDANGNVDPTSPDLITGNGKPLLSDRTDYQTDTEAVFASVSYTFNDRWNVTVEGRQTWEQKEANNTDIAPFRELLGDVPTGRDDEDFDYFTPRVTVDYALDDNSMIYANVAKGVKSGGINGGVTGSESSYDPEENITYEIGTKLTTFGGHARINISAYYIDWTDQQINGFASDSVAGSIPDTVVRNLGETEVVGLEADIRYQVSANWGVTVAYSYNDTEIQKGVSSQFFGYEDYAELGLDSTLYPTVNAPVTDVADATPYVPVGFADVSATDVMVSSGDLTGNSLPGTAENTVTLGADFVKEFNGFGLYSNLTAVWKDKRYLDVLNAQYVEDSWDVNFSTGVETESWRLGLNITNLLDDDTPATAYTPFANDGQPAPTGIARNGRMWNVSAAYKF